MIKSRDLSPGRTLRLANRLNFELGEKTFPPDACPVGSPPSLSLETRITPRSNAPPTSLPFPSPQSRTSLTNQPTEAPPLHPQETSKALRQETLVFKDPDILGLRAARWDRTVGVSDNKFVRGPTGTKWSEWRLAYPEPGLPNDTGALARDHTNVYLSNSRYETDILGATAASRSFVFSKDEVPGQWNNSTFIDRHQLEKQNKVRSGRMKKKEEKVLFSDTVLLSSAAHGFSH